MGLFFKILFGCIAAIIIFSVGIAILGAIFGITVGILGGIAGVAWKIVTSPVILVLIIIVLAVKLNKATAK